MKYIKEFVCDKLPTPNCHASTVLPLADGTVLAAWFGGTKESAADVDIWVARRDENGWCKPFPVSHAGKLPHWNPVLALGDGGEVMLFFKVGRHIPSWRTYISVSHDGGRSWRKSPKVKTEYAAPLLNSQNGHCSNRTPMIQPTLWESAPGCVHMLTRTCVGRIYRSDSADFGESWCEAYPTVLPNNNSGIDLVRVPSGDIYLVSNPVSENWGERSPLTLQRSRDNGESWETVMTLEEEKKGSEFSYPAIEYKNGCLHITYTYERLNIAYWRIEI